MSTPATLFFVDDDPRAGELFTRFLAGSDYRCRVFTDAQRALSAFEQEGADIVVTDLRMPEMGGTELLAEIRERDTEVPVIIVTAYASIDSAIKALRLGASDFIKKPYDPEELLLSLEKNLDRVRLERENRFLRRQLRDERLRYGMIGDSEPMQAVYRLIDKVAEVRCSVIIQGESGTGKELAARAIHDCGPNRRQPFVVVDCGGLNDTLLESELFGHRRGAFTGADRERKGLLEVAGEGTVFLDEIGNISEAMQMKLLRVLQEGRITPVGATKDVAIGARFIAATHRDLPALVAEGRFRHDLYHRLNVVTLTMPALAARREDIPTLIQHFADGFAAQHSRPVRGFSGAALRRLCDRPWEGNVRELRNFVERCVIMAEGEVLDDGQLACAEPSTYAPPASETPPPTEPAGATLAEQEALHIQRVLSEVGGNQTRAAARLGIDRSTLWRKLRQMRNAAG